MSLFAPDCERCGAEAVGYVTDDTAGAWLCRGDLKRYHLQAWSVGRMLGSFLNVGAEVPKEEVPG